MPLPLAPGSHLLRPVGADDQDRAGASRGARHPLSQVEQQADRVRVGPLQVVQQQQQRALPRHRLQHPRVLLEQPQRLGARSRGPSGPALDQFLQPPTPRRGRAQPPHPLQERGARQQQRHQIRSDLQQRLHRRWPYGLYTPGLLAAGTGEGPGFRVPGQLPQDLHKGKQGIAEAHVGGASPPSDHQLGMRRHSALSERAQQRRLAAPRLPDDKDHPAAPG